MKLLSQSDPKWNDLTEAERLERWLAARREVVTSTGLAALMGVPGAYGAPISEFLEKLGRSERGDPPEYIEWGKMLQRPTLIGYSEREGVAIDLIDEYEFVWSGTSRYLGTSLDARVQGHDERCVDAKNIGVQDPVDWGEPYSDQVPARYVVQLHGQMEATDTKVADLAVLFGGRKLVIYRIERDEEIIAACREAAEQFMKGHVIPAVQAITAGEDPMRYAPPVDGSEEWRKFLSSRKQRFKDYLDVAALPDAEAATIIEWATKLEAAKERKEEVTLEESTAANHLRQIIGEHAGIVGPFGRIHYKRSKDGETFDAEGYIRYLEQIAMRSAGAHAPALDRVKAKRYTTPKPGNRPLLPKWSREAKGE